MTIPHLSLHQPHSTFLATVADDGIPQPVRFGLIVVSVRRP